MCEKIVIPPFHFDHLPNPKSPHCSQDSESAKYLLIFGGSKAPTDLFVSKKPKIMKYSVWVRLETWTLEYQKSVFFKNLGLFGTWYEKMCPSFLWTTNSYFLCGQASMLDLDIYIKVSFESKKCEKWIIHLHPFVKWLRNICFNLNCTYI